MTATDVDQPAAAADESVPPEHVEPRVPQRPRQLVANLPRIAMTGTLLWVVALVATLFVPAWHSDDRDWWPQACAVGIVIGLIGYALARRYPTSGAAARDSR